MCVCVFPFMNSNTHKHAVSQLTLGLLKVSCFLDILRADKGQHMKARRPFFGSTQSETVKDISTFPKPEFRGRGAVTVKWESKFERNLSFAYDSFLPHSL